jgi:beta-N-acetylhexosaminidase
VPGGGPSRTRVGIAFLLALGCIAAGSGVAAPGLAGAAPQPSGVANGGGTLCASVAGDRDQWVECTLNAMSVADRVGQLFVVNGFGESVDTTDPKAVASNKGVYGPGISNLSDLINTYRPGGVIYFTWSNTLDDPTKIAQLSNGIQQVALQQPAQAPMLISTDQEEGEVVRVATPATVFPGNMALGATRSLELTRSNAAITGQELRAMGINDDNAPVVDVNVNPLNTSDGARAFGDRIDFVSRYGVAAINAYQGPGQVGAVAKHWPGLGDTTANPDTGVTTSDQTLAQFQQFNFPPFKAAIDAGVGSVMVTHVQTPNIPESPTLPSSLSPFFVTTQLRQSLGFNGVAVTDALNAAALEKYTPGEVATLAIQAGEDELVEIGGFPKVTPGQFVPAYQALLAAVNSGEIPLERVNESVRRILGLKWDLGLATNPITAVDQVDQVVGTADHLRVARRTAARSITLVRNQGGLLPLRRGTGKSVLSTGWGTTSTGVIADDIASHGLAAQSLPTGPSPSEEQIQRVVQAARGFDFVVVNTYNAWAPDMQGQVQQLRLVRELRKTKTPVIVLSLGTPYDIAYFPRVQAFLGTYSYQHVSEDAAVAAMFGNVAPHGKLPVTITDPRKPNHVLYPFGWGEGY